MSLAIQEQVLVLNRLWQAVNVCSARRAVALLSTGHAQVVYEDHGGFNTFSFDEWCDLSEDHDGQEIIRTISLRIRVPRIILLQFFDRLPNKDVKFTRHNVFERDKHTCQYCGKRFDRRVLTIDHVVPRQRGGQTTWKNVVCCCSECNRHKANRTPEEARMKLLSVPKKPRWRPFMEVHFHKRADHSWRHFLDLSRWHVKIGDT